MAQYERKTRPGIMLYFSEWDDLEEYSHEEIGSLIVAMLEYAQYGVIPEYDDRSMRQKWRDIQRIVDRDAAKYTRTCIEKAYAAWLRINSKTKAEVSFDDWLMQYASEEDRQRIISVDTSQPQSTPVDTSRPIINSQLSITNSNSNSNNQLPTANLSIASGAGEKGCGGKPQLEDWNEINRLAQERIKRERGY